MKHLILKNTSQFFCNVFWLTIPTNSYFLSFKWKTGEPDIPDAISMSVPISGFLRFASFLNLNPVCRKRSISRLPLVESTEIESFLGFHLHWARYFLVPPPNKVSRPIPHTHSCDLPICNFPICNFPKCVWRRALRAAGLKQYCMFSGACFLGRFGIVKLVQIVI